MSTVEPTPDTPGAPDINPTATVEERFFLALTDEDLIAGVLGAWREQLGRGLTQEETAEAIGANALRTLAEAPPEQRGAILDRVMARVAVTR